MEIKARFLLSSSLHLDSWTTCMFVTMRGASRVVSGVYRSEASGKHSNFAVIVLLSLALSVDADVWWIDFSDPFLVGYLVASLNFGPFICWCWCWFSIGVIWLLDTFVIICDVIILSNMTAAVLCGPFQARKADPNIDECPPFLWILSM